MQRPSGRPFSRSGAEKVAGRQDEGRVRLEGQQTFAKRVQFSSPFLPYLFLAPQLAIIFVFFYWPSVQAIQSSFYLEDPFGFGATFVGMSNYTDVLKSTEYLGIAQFTAIFTALVAFFALSIGLLLAIKADGVIRGNAAYKTLLIWVYAIAPPVAGLIGMMFFNQHIGPLVEFARWFGWDIKVGLDYSDTAFAMIVVSVWKQIPYNFIFFLSGLQAFRSRCARRRHSTAAPSSVVSGRSSCHCWRRPLSSC